MIELSSGEHKKLQLVKAFWLKPQILIIDQPYTGLDVKSRKNLNQIFENLTQEDVKSKLDGNTILIDIRDIRELWREGTIENSKHIPRGMLEFWLDPSSHYYKEEFSVEKRKILFCAQGMRSALATKTLGLLLISVLVYISFIYFLYSFGN